jgi:hypothetical protein
MKKYKGEELESFQIGILEAVDSYNKSIDREAKYKYVYNSKEESSPLDSVMEPLMARYGILYNSHFQSFCGTDEDPAYDAGFDFAMDSMITATYGKDFIDSLTKVGKKEHSINYNAFLKSMESMDSIDCLYCEGKRKDGWWLPDGERMLYPLQKLDNDSNNFEFIENCVNSKVMKFNVHIDKNGKVTQVDSITIENYGGKSESIDKYNSIIQFVSENLKENITYRTCMYKNKPKKYMVRQFFCFRWTE